MAQLGLSKITKPDYEDGRWDIPVNQNWETIAAMCETLITGYRYIDGLSATNTGLSVTVAEGVIEKNSLEKTVSSSTFSIADDAVTFVYADSNNAIATGATLSESDILPLYVVSAVSGSITYIGDLRHKANTCPGKNLLINGGFNVWQRGYTQTNSEYGSDDRWYNGHLGSTKVHSIGTFDPGQTVVPGNPKYYSSTVVTSITGAGNYVTKEQRIDGVDTLSGCTCTLSFYAKADSDKNIAIDFEQYFGSSGSTAISGIGAHKIAVTSTMQKYSITVVCLPSIYLKTISDDNCLNVRFWFDAGSDFDAYTDTLGQQSGTFDIAEVKLENGSISTNTENEAYAETLAKCQTFYWQGTAPGMGKGYKQGVSSSIAQGISICFPRTLRDSPAVTYITAPTYVGCTFNSITSDENGMVEKVATTDGLLYRVIDGVYAADAELRIV